MDAVLTIEHASIRQRVKHGYILVWIKKDSNGKTVYEHVVSWKIYPTKTKAMERKREIESEESRELES